MQRYEITGMSCAACASHVEKAVAAVPGVQSVSVSLLTNSMQVEAAPDADAAALQKRVCRAVEAAGYGAAPADDTMDGALDDTETPRLKKRLIHSLCFLVPLMYLSMGHMIGLPLPPFLEGSGPGALVYGLLQLALTLPVCAQELEQLDENKTVIDNVESEGYTPWQIRAVLSNFLFYDDDVNKKVSVLSPGEKARVALCKILLQKANLLILDEPTNHLDPETQKIIGGNFNLFEGTIIAVSHNPSFVEQIGISRMLILPSGRIEPYSRELLEYYYEINGSVAKF